MSTRVTFVGMIALIAAAIAVSAYLYPALPEQMASHWNIHGDVDGYMSKLMAVAMVPLIMLVVFLVWWVIPQIDPKKKNLEEFMGTYNMFFIALDIFFLYIYGLTLAWNLGNHFNLAQFLTPALALLFACVGVLLLNSKPNWFVGIRTPWTLTSEENWVKTHKLGAVLFEVSALIMLFGVVFPDWTVVFVLVPIVVTIVAVILYSFIEFQREVR